MVTLWKYVAANGVEKAAVIKSSILKERIAAGQFELDTSDLELEKNSLQVCH